MNKDIYVDITQAINEGTLRTCVAGDGIYLITKYGNALKVGNTADILREFEKVEEKKAKVKGLLDELRKTITTDNTTGFYTVYTYDQKLEIECLIHELEKRLGIED